jgi:Cro/C1-type HTH DNA-binding domain
MIIHICITCPECIAVKICEKWVKGLSMLRLRIKEVATSKGYNMSTLSRVSDVPFITIRRAWKNPYYELRLATLHKIAMALGVPTSELIEDVEE